MFELPVIILVNRFVKLPNETKFYFHFSLFIDCIVI